MLKYSLKRECLRHLRQTFGLQTYRPGQKAAVHALLSGRDAMCILPTGAGKSLCWQLPAVVHVGLTVVVSPLIALMRDQVSHLAEVGISALSLDSLMEWDEREAATARIRSGEVRIVFVSPERLEQEKFRRLCAETAPWLVVVDEAHCVLKWGESFRPAYAAIADFLQGLPNRPVLCAMTATADADMQRAIRKSLGMRRTKLVLLPAVRENIKYEVRTTLDRTGDILRLVQQYPCKTVIFCRTRLRVQELSALLIHNGVSSAYYHAGLERAERMAVQTQFQAGEVDVLCATTAFGMGVDIPDIRRIIHDYLPDNVIDYVQQSGRCGRDGEPATCVLLFEPNALVSKATIHAMAREKFNKHPIKRRRYLRKYWQGVRQLMRVLFHAECIPASIVRSFGGRAHPCGQCSACCRIVPGLRIPSFARMRQWQLRGWILQWQRDALAAQRGKAPGQIAPDRALDFAARNLAFPEDVSAPPELERLLQHFLRGDRA